MLNAFIKILSGSLAENNGMAKRKGAPADGSIRLTLVLDGQDAYESDTQVIFFFLTQMTTCHSNRDKYFCELMEVFMMKTWDLQIETSISRVQVEREGPRSHALENN